MGLGTYCSYASEPLHVLRYAWTDSFVIAGPYGGHARYMSSLWKSCIFLQAAEEHCESRGYQSIVSPGSESVSPFHLFHPFMDWSELVGGPCLKVVGVVFLWCFCCCFLLLTNLCDRVVYR